MSAPTIETARLRLRPFRESDLEAYTAVLQAEPVRSSLRLAPTIGREEAWAQMAAFSGQWALRGTGQLAVEERATGAFVGRAGLHNPERHDWPGVEVGWTLHPDHWGQGYATEAGAASVAYAVDELGCDEVWSVILPGNTRSQAVATRLGLRLVDTKVLSFFPDEPHGLWRITAAEWHARTG